MVSSLEAGELCQSCYVAFVLVKMFVMDKKAFVELMKGNHEEREEMESAWALMSHEIVPHGPEHSAQIRIVVRG